MLGEHVVLDSMDFQPYLPDHKDGYYELEQLKPGIVSCPHCGKLIDIKEDSHVKATAEALSVWPDSWASVPICKCPCVWAVYSPKSMKWAFRYRIETDNNNWQ